ncbi:MAG: DNA-binding response regulator [Clostridium sp.]
MACLNKEEVKRLYLKGLTSKEISRELFVKEDSVKKCIQRNFKELNFKHTQEKRIKSFQDKEVIKATNYEAKRWMGDKTFIQKNRSIYKTQHDGDLVLKKDIDCELPWDVPRRLNNEFKGCY